RRAQRPRPRAGRDGRARGQGERRARPGGVRMADGVGSTEPPRSGGAGIAGAGAGSGVGSTEPPRSGGAGFAGAGSGVGSTEPPWSGGAGFAGAGAGISVDPVTFEVIRNAL